MRRKRAVCRTKRKGRRSRLSRVRAAKLGWRRKKARGGRKLSCRSRRRGR